MRVGARIVKTGIALIVALFVCDLFQLNTPVIAAVAATLSIQPTVYRTVIQLREQFEANIIGAVIGVTATYFLGPQPIVVGLVVMLVIIINLKLKLHDSLVLSVITVVSVMELTTGNYWQFAWNRFFLNVIGILSAAVVNAIFIPPRYEKRLFNEIHELADKFSLLLRTLINNEMDERAFREEKEKVKSGLKKVETLFDMYTEEKTRFRKVTYSRSKKRVLFKQMITVLHKEMDMLRTLERHIFSSFETTHYLFPIIQQQLTDLTEYHKSILMTYQGLLKVRESWHIPETIAEKNEHLMDEFMSLYPADKNAAGHEDDNGWRHLFPIVAEIMEYSVQLEHLDKLVHSFQTHIPEEE
ncbi:aromatic acid exporter family protein [Aneurinibacillus sp. Ricciae_BoGa-3]|uniref:FUSC family protein n=1 Tax=Aneurinibacillus sp. Ricciae_BoGa-3 TaxID=3022697 RepID=UPI0023421654|nr:aromatic acid exporter family protein [Aneurinibacillus sp. Ricciae_BoGa-3]WCK55350.1 aromatic acid exporter family protein [Aneurinibacillus sp. Ricciae_BoGa-3]